ncbi:unnamed protein product [Heterosigma akashiwo]|uniref:Uncharacterized protein n=1 Tax=Heterosigma akashiwo TaxID=2829 RepID=A0A6V1P9W6_HETAK|mmetsp:Transcript_5042/g.7000  ORF Transcript_5042/g.7000 Transcript_5042/m.7000 type:complete len:334 (+) Transcript_5042:119-1120(+)
MDCQRSPARFVNKRKLLATAPSNQPDPTLRLLGGMTSGVIEALILTPLDVTKTRLQLDHAGRYRGMVDCGRQLVAAEGPRALYKGLAPWTWHVVLKNGSRYYFNAVYRQMLSDPSGGISTQRQFVAGLLAGATEATLIVTPFEVLKTRLQATDRAPPPVRAAAAAPGGGGAAPPPPPPKYTGMVQAATRIAQVEGPLALWNGLAPTIVRQSVNQGCSFATNGLLRTHVWRVRDGEPLEVWKSALSGVLGAIPGPVLNCPADVVKTRLMNQETPKGGAPPKYRGPIHALTTIAKEEGPRALYKGLLPRLARLCPSYAIQWVAVDQFMQIFGGRV